MNNVQSFASAKKNRLGSIDLSKKGSIDQPIIGLVAFINSKEFLFTTSSCSGRILLFSRGETKKKGCLWHLVSHVKLEDNALKDALANSNVSDVTFKFEPLILHIQCWTLADAQKLLAVSVASGYRNSGISIGKKGKIILAVRSTQCLAVPIPIVNGSPTVSDKVLYVILLL